MNLLSQHTAGNTTIMVMILSLAAMTAGVTIATSQTESIIASKNLAKASTAYLEAEGNVEEALYVYAGHDLGFETSSSGDRTCDGNDTWCLETEIDATTALNYDLQAYDFMRVGLYNDTAGQYANAFNENINESDLIIKVWDGNSSRKVGIGDMRVNNFNGFEAQSLVKEADWDVTTTTYLAPITTTSDFKISGNDHIWEKDSVVYRDLDNSGKVSTGDIRVTAYLDYPANSAVGGSDDDFGFFLHSADNLSFQCSNTDLDCNGGTVNNNHIYASKTATITILSKVDGESNSWTRTLSKNQTTGGNAAAGNIINASSTENTNLSPGRSISELFDTPPSPIDLAAHWASINLIRQLQYPSSILQMVVQE
jgi:hypothetical protein